MHNALSRGEIPPENPLVAAAEAEQRVAPRYTLLIRAAKLICEAGEFLVVIRDVSESGISVRTFHHLPQARNMVIELQNGDRHDLTLVWQEQDRAGFRFAMMADIARIIASPSRFAKRDIRLSLEAPAEVKFGADRVEDVQILNLSQQGAQITCACRFAIDERVRISAAGLPETHAKVRWRKDGMSGLVFEDTYQYGELARITARLQRGN